MAWYSHSVLNTANKCWQESNPTHHSDANIILYHLNVNIRMCKMLLHKNSTPLLRVILTSDSRQICINYIVDFCHRSNCCVVHSTQESLTDQREASQFLWHATAFAESQQLPPPEQIFQFRSLTLENVQLLHLGLLLLPSALCMTIHQMIAKLYLLHPLKESILHRCILRLSHHLS